MNSAQVIGQRPIPPYVYLTFHDEVRFRRQSVLIAHLWQVIATSTTPSVGSRDPDSADSVEVGSLVIIGGHLFRVLLRTRETRTSHAVEAIGRGHNSLFTSKMRAISFFGSDSISVQGHGHDTPLLAENA